MRQQRIFMQNVLEYHAVSKEYKSYQNRNELLAFVQNILPVSKGIYTSKISYRLFCEGKSFNREVKLTTKKSLNFNSKKGLLGTFGRRGRGGVRILRKKRDVLYGPPPFTGEKTLVVAQKSIFWKKKISEKVANSCRPSPVQLPA